MERRLAAIVCADIAGYSRMMGTDGAHQTPGPTKELSQSRTGAAISRAPTERRLGDRSLPSQRLGSLALLAAQARGRASQTILHWLPRLRSARGRLSRGRQRCVELQQGRNPVLDNGVRPIADQRQQRSRPLARGNAGSRQARRHWPYTDRPRAVRSD